MNRLEAIAMLVKGGVTKDQRIALNSLRVGAAPRGSLFERVKDPSKTHSRIEDIAYRLSAEGIAFVRLCFRTSPRGTFCNEEERVFEQLVAQRMILEAE